MPYLRRTNRFTNQQVRILIDSGASRNYCRKGVHPSGRIKLSSPARIQSIHNISETNYYYKIKVFGHNLIFYEIDDLEAGDLILGFDGLKALNAKFDFGEDKITFDRKLPYNERFNYTVNPNINNNFKNELKSVIDQCIVNTNLPFNTQVEATVRTVNETPVWAKTYPYPFNVSDFVKKEINNLLSKGIIRPSNSPYNAPILVVDKKGFDENGQRKKRLVFDYKKLNANTIADKYPIPVISIVLSNLGKAKYFSTVDLESGYHQIKIQEQDCEKTAFSINNSKFEFVRMPFGLKNAPSIFQRALDDIMKDFIGKFVHVYIDDILIYSQTEEEHFNHIKLVLNKLKEANMAISSEKSKFFEKEVEFLGHIISNGQIRMDPEKIRSIKEYVEPTNLKALRGFLGLMSHYRKFIQNYAKIAKPLTEMLRNNPAKKNESSRVKITFDHVAKETFEELKNLISEQLELFQPDFNKPFELTTDASNKAIGGVLSQDGRPVTFISRTLSTTEENYATNEKEMLAIVWALHNLRNYLYGKPDTIVYTDHQPLTFATSDKNPNTKLKRWKAFIEECGVTLRYKPGKENVVADALSRQHCYNIDTDANTMHSRESSSEIEIERINAPINSFQYQFHLIKSDQNYHKFENITCKRRKNTIQFTNLDYLEQKLVETFHQTNLNVIHSDLQTLNEITPLITNKFAKYKIKHSDKLLIDLTEIEEIEELIALTHKRAHRNWRENMNQILLSHYFEDMTKKTKQFALNCQICHTCKYDRRPQLELIGKTPIPTAIGQILHMDVFFINKEKFVTCVDSYSKFLIIKQIGNVLDAVREILNIYPNCMTIMTDNDPMFLSHQVNNYLERKKIEHLKTAVNHSTTNGQVERTHSTLTEIIRCLIKEKNLETHEAIFEAVKEYNHTIHSVIKNKPSEVFQNPNQFDLHEVLKQNQENVLRVINKNRKLKEIKVNDAAYTKNNRRNKLEDRFRQIKIKEVHGHIVKADKNKVYHKDNIKCVPQL